MPDRKFDRKGLKGYIDDEWKPVNSATKWTCIRCGRCCKHPWSVDLTWIEFDRLTMDPRITKMPEFKKEIDPESGMDHPYFLIDGACPMLNQDGMICTIYPDWLYTCATYPFLLMPDGQLLIHTGCNGIGHGEVVDIDPMMKKILMERKRAGMITEK